MIYEYVGIDHATTVAMVFSLLGSRGCVDPFTRVFTLWWYFTLFRILKPYQKRVNPQFPQHGHSSAFVDEIRP